MSECSFLLIDLMESHFPFGQCKEMKGCINKSILLRKTSLKASERDCV